MNVFEFILFCLQWLFKLIMGFLAIEVLVIAGVMFLWFINLVVEVNTGINLYERIRNGKR